MYRVLSLFAGIGGFDLGLERTGGFKTVAFCEIDPFCQRVLAKHWPGVPCYDDVRTLTAERLAADGIEIDVICGGFPCQDISFAGKGAGLGGERSGLWSEYARLIGELRPRFVIVENVAALLARGLDAVLGTLAALGYDAEWHCIPAAYVGAPHRRDRIWIIAHPRGEQHESCSASLCGTLTTQFSRPDPDTSPLFRPSLVGSEQDRDHAGVGDLADAPGERRDGCREGSEFAGRAEPANRCWWRVEPDVGRVAHGVPARVDRLRSLGNAVVPQIPELIGRAILASRPQPFDHLSNQLSERNSMVMPDGFEAIDCGGCAPPVLVPKLADAPSVASSGAAIAQFGGPAPVANASFHMSGVTDE